MVLIRICKIVLVKLGEHANAWCAQKRANRENLLFTWCEMNINIGEKFGNWTVIGKAPDRVDSSGRHHSRVTVQCECGTIIDKDVHKLKNGAKMCRSCYLKIARYNSIPFEHKQNRYEFENGIGIGYASNTNSKFIFDADDYELIKDIYWHENESGYIYSTDLVSKRKIGLHRYIMKINDNSLVVDHINRNPKDCRKENLRVCTQKENVLNKSIYKNNKSGFTGVMQDKKTKKWIAYINKDKSRHVIGYYKTKEEAVCARRVAEKEYFKEFAPN